MSDSVELKFPVVAHHRLIVDAAKCQKPKSSRERRAAKKGK